MNHAAIGHNQGPIFDPEERWDAIPRLGQSYACPKVLIRDLPPGLIPESYFKVIEDNQKQDPDGRLWVQPCCRRIRTNGMIEAWYSSELDRERRIPDIYILTCTDCGRLHRQFCVGGSINSGCYPEYRPFWPSLDFGKNHSFARRESKRAATRME